MPVIVFIIDNSASMNQTTYLGTSYLDLAKSAIENFLKVSFFSKIFIVITETIADMTSAAPIIPKKSMTMPMKIYCSINENNTPVVFVIPIFVGSSWFKAIFKNVSPITPMVPPQNE